MVHDHLGEYDSSPGFKSFEVNLQKQCEEALPELFQIHSMWNGTQYHLGGLKA